jgi:UPF0271 protein
VTIDLNADVGEAGGEEPLYALVTSVNVACGGHAGDLTSMADAVRRAAAHGVTVGAHPGYPDRARFGRQPLPMDAAELVDTLAQQIDALARICRGEGVPLVHVKPHGALYHAASQKPTVAQAIADAAPGLVLVGLAGSPALAWWSQGGRHTVAEGFADRVYEPNGTLRSREKEGALILEPDLAAAQALRLARSGSVDTLCVHADTPGATGILARVRAALEEAGIRAAAGRRASR